MKLLLLAFLVLSAAASRNASRAVFLTYDASHQVKARRVANSVGWTVWFVLLAQFELFMALLKK